MYFKYLVKVPDSDAAVTRKRINGITYVYYAYGRTYDPVKKYSVPKNTTIGKCLALDPSMMYPNANYLRFFPNEDPSGEDSEKIRSACLKIGPYVVIKKIVDEYKLRELLCSSLEGDPGLFLDLAAYTIITENNAGQYYPCYAYDHPLFTEGMKIMSDSTVSRYLSGLTRAESSGFQSHWTKAHKTEDMVYVSYDSTNKDCQAGDIHLAEFGHPKDGSGLPVVNFAVTYDTDNSVPLFYEDYPGSIVDISELKYMVEKAKAYGYEKLCFILDRGYFSEPNLHAMEKAGYSFIIMMKGMKELVRETVLSVKGTFEEDYACNIREYKLSGITVKKKLFDTDTKERYVHIYYSDQRKSLDREKLEKRLDEYDALLEKHEGKEYPFPKSLLRYYSPSYSPKNKAVFLCATKKTDAINEMIRTCGYFCLITSDSMTAAEAIRKYKGRDVSEKLFRGDKSYLGDQCYRIQSEESLHAKVFVEFVALIIRNRIYTCLHEQARQSLKKQNYMNVVAAVKELEKIEMIRKPDGSYMLDHAVSATQKEILKAFGMTADDVKSEASKISEVLEPNKEEA